MVDNFKTYRLCYVKNHGIDENLIDEHFKAFCSSSELLTQQKEPLNTKDCSGWVKTGEFNFDPKSKSQDLNESLCYTLTQYHQWRT